ncbi:copper homeostasis protein CutC [Gynurincola endophyticus]|uniref:copper homeostasis protein CutC n=1 Tax=Gynurincola endophyticus TaxID=2479004 RepID=UPI000F8DFF81|nr:copper homeostasis protein CutC [Gynurincola endophyticus]
MSYQLEICAFDLASAIAASKYPIARIELCGGFEVGGTTPSFACLQMAREQIAIPVYPIIRPRGGDFVYTEQEFEMMLREIDLCNELGFEGISTGVQNEDGSIDEERMMMIVQAAYPMGVTCHRVFDLTPDPLAAMNVLIRLGVERILTSGQQASALEGATLIRGLVEAANGQMEIMAGAGITSSIIGELAEQSGTNVFHATAKKMIPAYKRSSPIKETGSLAVLDEEELKKLIQKLNKHFGLSS